MKTTFNPVLSIIESLPSDDYHYGEPYREYLSSSQLKLYQISPAAFHYAMGNPAEQTDAMRIGSLFHSLMQSLAEQHGDWEAAIASWGESMAVFTPPVNERTGQPYGSTTKACIEAYRAFEVANTGRIIAQPDEVSLVTEMARSLVSGSGETSRQVRSILGWVRTAECSYFYTDENGIKLKVRPDALTRNMLIDWKSIGLDNLNETNIVQQIIRYGYHISMSMYQWVLHEITGTWYRPYLVFVSKVPPHDCVICDIEDWCYFHDSGLDITGSGVGALEFERLLKLHTECSRSCIWPGVEHSIETNDRIMKPSVPAWLDRKYFNDY